MLCSEFISRTLNFLGLTMKIASQLGRCVMRRWGFLPVCNPETDKLVGALTD